LNIINSNEAWNEFRRTAYPKISGTDPVGTFVSIQSASSHHDKLPVRLVYPQTEINLNGDNIPVKRNPYSDLIFWDKE
ncbi:MAG: SusD/RagB family nutrient-binding outer membrane lipoprotein, partial [Dysgonamonadaceae bacterium]|nr:SusD/RagB family nutrient-binding outer membrane lipoprotein [Dysgonamonadaceae bacterium]